MNKGAIQRFAIWARTELIAQVSQRAYQYGITRDGYGEQNAVTVGGRALTTDEQRQRKELVDQIRSKGYTQVMEEVAYTWFNRFIALRFMEVNNYLPSHIRVFSDSTGAFKPEILNDVLHLDLPGLNTEKVAEYIEKNQTEDLYRYLLLTQCNALNAALPQMFERMGGFTELLLPNNILKQDSILGHMVTDIPEEDWTDQVQIIGWLYQYYNSELKDDTFALLKKNVKITKERIPSATQLFTPDWIVRYMVENSLGRIFIEKRKNEGVFADGRGADEMTWEESEAKRIANEKYIAEQMGWKYYLPEAEQTQEIRQQLDEIQREYANLDVKEIKVIDPCMGSGHILVYAFDVLMQIYEANGYSQRDAAQSILENNLYGLDIDDRAAQLAYFAVMMKARQYDRRIFSRGIQPHIYAIVESNGLDCSTIDYFTNNDPKLIKDFGTLVDELRDAKEYGSILNISQVNFAALYARVEEVREDISIFREVVLSGYLPLIQVAQVMAQKYDVVVTNPPYMGASGMSAKLSDFVKKYYLDSKSDLFAVFIERCGQMARKNGYQAMITQHAWMFLSSYEKLRAKLERVDTVNMAHLGPRAFEEIGGEVVQTTSFVLRKTHTPGYKGTYCRLIEPTTQQGKEEIFLASENRYVATQDNFTKIPGSPVAYWVSEQLTRCFALGSIYQLSYSTSQNKTGNNDRFLRKHWEIKNTSFGKDKWIFYAKGGEFRKWWGNLFDVINWTPEARNVYQFGDGKHASQIIKPEFWYKKGITWGIIAETSFRVLPDNATFDMQGSSVFISNDDDYNCILGYLNSIVAKRMFSVLNRTIALQVRDIRNLPYENSMVEPYKVNIDSMVQENISISKNDWDSFETSWDFQRHPLLPIAEDGIGIFGGMKVGERKWIIKLRDGSACFSPVKDFIEQGEKTGNNEQGDKYEGVFARLKNGSPKIAEMENLLGDDLEKICDGEYTLLRRKSSKTVPVLCIYGFFKEDTEIVDQTDLGNGKYRLKLRLTPSEKMFDDFLNESTDYSDKKETWGMGFSVGHFQKSIESALDKKGIVYKPVKVSYDIFDSEEFFIEPGQDYPELKHKAKRLSYQKEIRWILPETHRQDKLIVPYTALSNHSAGTFEEGSYFEFDVEGHVKGNMLISSCFAKWKADCATRFQALKAYEEELNRIFIDIYGLQDELMPEVEDKDVTVRRADLGRDVRSLISYAVGCMFGRYSLDEPGLAYAGGEWDASKYSTIIPDKDNIIPICDDDYFDDDITGRFVQWVETVYGSETLEENLKFIADALGGKGTPREVIRSYFINDFYADHLKIYQKRPIYWLFDSGKKNGFKALIYMHRYQSDLLARMRTDYVHEQQERYRTQLSHLADAIDHASASERVKLNKQIKKIQEQALEIQKYEEKVHHLADQNIQIDLDDGVKHNYELFADVLAKIK